MCPTSEPSGSRVTAPPPEPSEAMKQALAALQAVVDNSLCERCDPNGKLLIRASDARRPLEAALAVSPGCRGAELAELERALESYDAGGHPPERAATFALVDAVRKVVAAFRASGEAGPDPLAERVRTLERAVENASYALSPNQGEPPSGVEAAQWLRTAFRPDHPNYVDPATLGPSFYDRESGGVVG
jgi:hypothetical protein